MKAKYFPLRLNGAIAKTPIYFSEMNIDFLDKICQDNNIYTSYGYGIYRRARLIVECADLDIEDQLLLDVADAKRFLTTEEFKKALTVLVLDPMQKVIDEKISELTLGNIHAETNYKSKHENLSYVALEMETEIEKYRIRTRAINALSKGKLSYQLQCEENCDRYETHTVLEDVKPVPFEKVVEILSQCSGQPPK